MTYNPRTVIHYCAIIAFGGFVFGLDAALISGTVDYLQEAFSLDALQLGTLVGAPSLGILVALPFAGYICNRFGRKKALQLIALLYLISAIGSALAPTYSILYAARFLGGLAFTSLALASMFIGELAPSALRGKLVTLTQINIVIGLSGAYYFNHWIYQAASSGAEWALSLGLHQHTWRFMFGAEIPFALLWFLLIYLIPESPAWLIQQGKTDEARNLLARWTPHDQVTPAIEAIQAGLTNASATQHPDQPSTASLSIRQQLSLLFHRPMRTILIIAFTLAIAQQATGINAILFYAQTVFKQLGIGNDAAFAQTTYIGLTSIVFTVIGLLLVDRCGRRPLILWGMLWIVLSLALGSYTFGQARYQLTSHDLTQLPQLENPERLNPIAGITFTSDITFKKTLTRFLGEADAQRHQSALLEKALTIRASLALFAILSFIAAFHFSVGPLMWVLFSEIFPVAIRGIAIPLFSIVTSLTNYIIQLFFPWQLQTQGMSQIMLTYAVLVGIGTFVLLFVLKETKNRTLEEIQTLLISPES